MSVTPRYSMLRRGICSSPLASASVSARPCVSTTPTTTSRPAHLLAARRLEHGVGLADARAHAEEDLEPPARFRGLLALDGRQQRVGIGPSVVHRHGAKLPHARAGGVGRDHGAPTAASSARLSGSTSTTGSPRKPSCRPRVCCGHELAHRRLRHAARPRDARHLVARGRRADVRIETAARGGHEVDRDRAACCPGSAACSASTRPCTASTSASFSGP